MDSDSDKIFIQLRILFYRILDELSKNIRGNENQKV